MLFRPRLQQCAVAISIFSVFYNTAEGVLSVVFGAESSSRALVFYGLQSAVEVISALLVTWRFLGITKPGDETENQGTSQIVRIERIATITIGVLLVTLAVAAAATSGAALALYDRPSTALPALVISATATTLMLALYLAKRALARALRSGALHAEALCALSCVQLSAVLLVGSLVDRVWTGGWWVDSATAIVIGLLFGWEGVKMVRWARDEAFDGGCCADCRPKDKVSDQSAAVLPRCTTPTMVVEKPEGQGETGSPSHCCGCSKNGDADRC